MGTGIRLHPEHGLNPTISICFYCREEKNELLLLGAGYKGKAPMNMVTSLEPCDECKKKYTDYTLLVEVRRVFDEKAYSRREKEPEPTGRWLAVSREFLKNPMPIAFVEPETMNVLMEQAREVEEI